MTGPVALHGGGEFLAGDEAFLAALLDLAVRRVGDGRPVRVAVVPTAAARGRPDLAAANGVGAFERVARAGAWPSTRARSASSIARPPRTRGSPTGWPRPTSSTCPGGDPDLIPTVMLGSAAWAAITEAHVGGAVLAGASAGRDGAGLVDLDARAAGSRG